MAERGLLGRIGSGIQGLLGNPSVRGVGAAAAFGVNPLLGLLAAPAIRGNQTSRDRAALENQAARENLAERRSQREALNRLSGLLQSSSVIQGQGGVTPQGRRELQGVLAQAAPEGVAGLLAKQAFGQPEGPRLPTDVQAFLAAGGSLDDPQVQQALRDRVLNTEDPQAQLELNKLMLEVQNALDQRRQAQEDRDRSERAEVETFKDKSSNVLAVAQANEILTGTPLEPGSTGIGARRTASSVIREGAELLGLNSFLGTPLSDIKSREVAVDVFEKGSAGFARELTRDMERSTNLQFSNLKDSIPNLGISPEANAFILEPFVVEALNQHNNPDNQFRLQNPAEFEQALESLRRQQTLFRSKFGGAENVFPSQEAVEAAVNSGRVSIGDTVVINGEEFVVSPD